MATRPSKHAPGRIRDAVVSALEGAKEPLSVKEIHGRVVGSLGGPVASSSVRSYLQLNTPDMFIRPTRGRYALRIEDDVCREEAPLPLPDLPEPFIHENAVLYNADCLEWLAVRADASIHAVVTDPPYGLIEYSPAEQVKLRAGKGGVWRIPPSFDGHKRSPLPRFTVLNGQQLDELRDFFRAWGQALRPKLVPGANVIVASNPLLSYIVSAALAEAGLERRGELVRLTMTMRGGDRPKDAHDEFSEVSVMPRSMWEPWLVFRRPLEGRVQDNLRTWRTGGFRRPEADKPFGDVIPSSPTRKQERDLAPHPSLKPQEFLRRIVRAVLPLGEGVVFDPFAGSGSTLAAATAVGYASVGVERDPEYFRLAQSAIPALAAYRTNGVG